MRSKNGTETNRPFGSSRKVAFEILVLCHLHPAWYSKNLVIRNHRLMFLSLAPFYEKFDRLIYDRFLLSQQHLIKLNVYLNCNSYLYNRIPHLKENSGQKEIKLKWQNVKNEKKNNEQSLTTMPAKWFSMYPTPHCHF